MRTIEIGHADAGGEPISLRLIERVAHRAGVDETALPPLYHTIDPDALDALFRMGVPNTQVTFAYAGYEVTVRSDGGIDVDGGE